MTAVTAYPGAEAATHDVKLSNGSQEIGLIYAQGPRVLQEIPINDPARPFTALQKDWTGGAMRLKYADDPQAYHDAYALWTMTPGKMLPMMQWKYATGYRSCNSHMPGDVTLQNLFSATYISVIFTTAAAYSADKALLWLDWEGSPGTLTLSLCPDGTGTPPAGTPNLAAALKTATLTVSGATRHGPNVFDWTTTEALDGIYHLVITAAGQNTKNYWRVGVDASGTSSKTSANGTSWTAAAYTMYYRVTDADISRQMRFYEVQGSLYAVSCNDDESASKLFINGDTGIVTTGGASTTFTDTSSGVSTGWTTDQWIGYKVRIFYGPGDGLWRTITANTATQITVDAAWGVTLTTSSLYAIYDGPIWQEIAGHGLGHVTGHPAKYAENWVVGFPQGQSDYIRRIRRDYSQANMHNYEDDGTNVADVMVTYHNPKAGTELWLFDKNTPQYQYAASTATASPLVPSTKVILGDGAANINNAVVGGDRLYVLKEDSIWTFSSTYLPTMLSDKLKNAVDPSNGIAAFHDGELWFGWSHSIQKTEGSVYRDMLNYRVGSQGLKRGGIPKFGIDAQGWKFFVMDSEGVSGTRSSIIAWNGLGWQEIFRGWSANARIRNVHWHANQGGRSKLWFDVNGELCYMEFPQYAANPLLDTTLPHQHYAEFVSSTFDGNKIELKKLLHSATLVAENDESRDWEIILDYQADKDLGSDTWYRAGSLQNLTTDEFSLDLGEVNEWRVRLRFYTSDADSPAVLNSYDIEGWIHTLLKHQWVGTFKVDENQRNLQGDEDFSPDDILDFLRTAHSNAERITLGSTIESMHDHVVSVSAPSVVRNWTRAEDGKQKWGGLIQIAFREA